MSAAGRLPVAVSPPDAARAEPLSPEEFQSVTSVSRETLAQLKTYADLLGKWQRAINLVSRDSMGDLWRRHMLDSAQLFPLLPSGARRLVDLGSGAGFPGMVLAILGVPEVHLVESDARKCAFLREVSRIVGVSPHIHTRRLEIMHAIKADVVTARALAPLSDLLQLAERFLEPHSICLFLKGRGADQELTAAGETWKMKVTRHTSVSDPSGTILRLEHVHRERAS